MYEIRKFTVIHQYFSITYEKKAPKQKITSH